MYMCYIFTYPYIYIYIYTYCLFVVMVLILTLLFNCTCRDVLLYSTARRDEPFLVLSNRWGSDGSGSTNQSTNVVNPGPETIPEMGWIYGWQIQWMIMDIHVFPWLETIIIHRLWLWMTHPMIRWPVWNHSGLTTLWSNQSNEPHLKALNTKANTNTFYLTSSCSHTTSFKIIRHHTYMS